MPSPRQSCRGSFPQIVEAGRAVAAVLRARAAEGAAVDVDNLLQRQVGGRLMRLRHAPRA